MDHKKPSQSRVIIIPKQKDQTNSLTLDSTKNSRRDPTPKTKERTGKKMLKKYQGSIHQAPRIVHTLQGNSHTEFSNDIPIPRISNTRAKKPIRSQIFIQSPPKNAHPRGTKKNRSLTDTSNHTPISTTKTQPQPPTRQPQPRPPRSIYIPIVDYHLRTKSLAIKFLTLR
jgi:hypothetical protein